jgi:hypothetical protein
MQQVLPLPKGLKRAQRAQQVRPRSLVELVQIALQDQSLQVQALLSVLHALVLRTVLQQKVQYVKPAVLVALVNTGLDVGGHLALELVLRALIHNN